MKKISNSDLFINRSGICCIHLCCKKSCLAEVTANKSRPIRQKRPIRWNQGHIEYKDRTNNANAIKQEEKTLLRALISIAAQTALIKSFTSFSLKNNNQRSISLAQNQVLFMKTKYMNILYYYICNKVVVRKIDLQYISMLKIIIDKLIKAFIQANFYLFV